MRILFKKIDNEKQYEQLWNKVFKINAISGLLLGLIFLIPLIKNFFDFINSGFDFLVLGSLFNGVISMLFDILIVLMVLSTITLLGKGKRNSEKDDDGFYFILSLTSGVIFIISFLGLFSFFNFTNSFFEIFRTTYFILFIIVLLIISTICLFTSILWFIIFRNKWNEYCEKVKNKSIAKKEKLLKIEAKRETKLEIINENKQFEKLKNKKQKLQELKEMLEEKLITEERYEDLRKKIIERDN